MSLNSYETAYWYTQNSSRLKIERTDMIACSVLMQSFSRFQKKIFIQFNPISICSLWIPSFFSSDMGIYLFIYLFAGFGLIQILAIRFFVFVSTVQILFITNIWQINDDGDNNFLLCFSTQFRQLHRTRIEVFICHLYITAEWNSFSTQPNFGG